MTITCRNSLKKWSVTVESRAPLIRVDKKRKRRDIRKQYGRSTIIYPFPTYAWQQ